MEETYNIGSKVVEGEIFSSGIAYIVLPGDVERDVFIADCYRTSTVSIYSEHNGFHNRVPIDQYSLNFIKFPADVNTFGSAVSFSTDQVQKRIFVNGIFLKTNEVTDLVENQFKFRRELNGNFVEIVGSPDGKYLTLNVSADKAGEVDINVKSADESAAVNIQVDGSFNVKSIANTNLRQYRKFSSVTVNREDDSESASFEQDSVSHTFFDNNHNVNTEKLSINNGEEPFVLGKKFAQFMKDFIKEVSQSTVSTAIGQQPLLNAEEIDNYEQKVDELLSEIGFIDK